LNLLVFHRQPSDQFWADGPYVDQDEIEQKKLIRRLELLDVPFHMYQSENDFAAKARDCILSLLERLYFSKLGALFLSYSRKDHKLADQIGAMLRTSGFNVWQDSSSIETGANWPEQLAAGIEASDIVLFLASGNSASSPYCSKEIAHATNLRKPMLTAHLDDLELPTRIAFLVSDSQHLWLSRYEGLDSAAAEISRAARNLISQGKTS
jgi:hypothetical protein